MNNRSLFIFLIIAVASLFVLDKIAGPEGITGRYDQTNRGVYTCIDTDPSNDVHVKGTVTTNTGGKIKEYNDACVGGGGRRVKQNYCDGDQRKFTYDWCPGSEVCNDGKCVADRSSQYY